MDARTRTLADLMEALREVGGDHALVGGLAVGYHGRPRATIDVDLLVPRRTLKPLVRALKARGYFVKTLQDKARAYSPGTRPERDEAAVDLFCKEANPVFRAAFDAVESATVLGHRVKVVRRGALVALKFHAALSPARRVADKYQDIADIGRVLTKRFDARDSDLAHRIAELIHRAGEQLDQLVDDLKHNRPVTI
jgi:hypothetical protein